ncbi:hypothetical protein PQQ65_17950 [Paraburkholderia strydomiana]|uniref:hypothetical protein n=1 Tax=Paraburkholderia strydomiana TaxID=1245417 RepID=UPI0038BDB3B3
MVRIIDRARPGKVACICSALPGKAERGGARKMQSPSCMIMRLCKNPKTPRGKPEKYSGSQ